MYSLNISFANMQEQTNRDNAKEEAESGGDCTG
jgi:hypothetical protein